jgi:YVTN family beta-propeller protein
MRIYPQGGGAAAIVTSTKHVSPWGAARNAKTNKVYTVNYGSQDVTVIDGTTGATTDVPIGKHSWAIAVDAKADKIYAVSEDSASVTIIQGATNAATTVGVGAISFAVEVNPAEQKAYSSNNVTVIRGVAAR